jgi:hypothetical protein
VGLARFDDVVARLVLLEHAPHGFDVVAGVAPVSRGVKVAESDGILEAELDPSNGVADLALQSSSVSPT